MANNRDFPVIRITKEAKAHLQDVVDTFNALGFSMSMSSKASEEILRIKKPEVPQEEECTS